MKPCFLPPHPPRATHPATLSMVQQKIKHDLFYGHVLAVGSFTSSPFRSGVPFFPLRFILYTILHYIPPTFISPTSAPHSKSNSLSAFRKAITQAFRVMAFAYHLATMAFAFFDKLQKAANASKQNAHATSSHQPGLLHSVQSLHLLLTHRTFESGMLYFFLRSVYPNRHTKDISVPIKI